MASRPKTWIAILSPVAMGGIMAFQDGYYHLWTLFAIILGGLLIQIGTNLINDYSDGISNLDTQERLGPKRAVQSGLVEARTIFQWALICLLISLLIGIYLVYRGGWPVALLGISSLFFALFYSLGSFSLSRTGLGDLVVIFYFGVFPTAFTFYLVSLQHHPKAYLLGLGPGFLSLALLTANNLRDYNQDKKGGRKTLVVRFGIFFGKMEYILSIGISLCILGGYFAFNKSLFGLLIVSILFLFALSLCYQMIKAKEDHQMVSFLPRTALFLWIYTLGFCLGSFWKVL